MRKVLLVAAHQIKLIAFKWSFLFVLFGPLLSLLFTAIYFGIVEWTVTLKPVEESAPAPQVIVANPVAFDQPVGYVDPARLIAALPADIPSGRFIAFADEDSAKAAVRSGQIAGYYFIPPDYITSGTITYFGPSTTQFVGTDEALKNVLMFNLAGKENEAIARRLLRPMEVAEVTLATVADKPQGHYTAADLALGLGIAGLFYYIVQATGGRMLSYMIMEKRGRLIDILMTSASPLELLAGKFAGATLVGLVETATWLGWLWLFTGRIESLPDLPPEAAAPVLIIFVCGYFAYAGVFAVFSAMIRSYRESSVITTLVALGALAPLLWLFNVAAAPGGATATFLSLFPLSAPVAMTLRLLVSNVPRWQVAASAALLLAWTALMIVVAARLFRTRLLAGRSPAETIWRWLKRLVPASTAAVES